MRGETTGLYLFESESGISMKWYNVEKTVDNFVDRMMMMHLPWMEECYVKLEGTSQKNKFEYNDLDNHAWRVVWPSEREDWPGNQNIVARAFVHTCQNRKVLYVLAENPLAAIAVTPEAKDSFGPPVTVMMYDAHLDQYASEQGYESLKELVKRGGSRYDDCRDIEWIAGNGGLQKYSDGAWARLARAKWALFNIETLHCALENPS